MKHNVFIISSELGMCVESGSSIACHLIFSFLFSPNLRCGKYVNRITGFELKNHVNCIVPVQGI